MEPPKPKFNFAEPQKLIKTSSDMNNWEKSETYYDLLGFVNSICMCIQGKSQKYDCQVSPVVQKLLDMLDKLEKLALETPPVE
jgi:serine/threonine-protein phosphatase 2A activator